jgi:hypothetical protein
MDESPATFPLARLASLDEATLREFKDALCELLDRGSILGFESRTRDLYHRASGPLLELLVGALALLDLELVNDDRRLLLLARPLDSCTLLRRFDQAETLLVLAFWKIHDEHRQESRGGSIVLSLDDLFTKLKSYFPALFREPPKPNTWRRMLSRLQRRNLVRWIENTSAFGQSECEPLSTILYVIPFQDLTAWLAQADRFREEAPSTAEEPADDEPA